MKNYLTLLCLLCLLLCKPALALNPQGQAAYRTLKNTSTFALGGIGFTGAISEPEKALRVLLKQKDASAAFQALLQEARIEGQLYALIGLWWKDRQAFRQKIAAYRSLNVEATTMHGCIKSGRPVAAIVKEIQKGSYDVFNKDGRKQNR